MHRKTPQTQTPHTTRTRDAALRRLGHANRWLLAGSAALTGAFTAVAANAFPGRTVKASAGATHRTPAARKGSSRSVSPLKAPAQAPRSSKAQAPTQTAPEQESTPAQEAAPEQKSAPAQETSVTPTQESTPAQESAPTQEAAPEQKSAPAQETSVTPTQETEPARESAPAVSGGS
jgi:outer membrane biosynthesis protein TonB